MKNKLLPIIFLILIASSFSVYGMARFSETKIYNSVTPPETTTTSEGDNVFLEEATTTTQPQSTQADIDISSSYSPEATFNTLAGEVKTFTLDGKSQHSITVKEVLQGKAAIIIQSAPVAITLSIGESKDINIDGDSANDITVKLLAITNDETSISIKNLNPSNQNALTSQIVLQTKPVGKIWLSAIIGVVIIGVIISIMLQQNKRKKYPFNRGFRPSHDRE